MVHEIQIIENYSDLQEGCNVYYIDQKRKEFSVGTITEILKDGTTIKGVEVEFGDGIWTLFSRDEMGVILFKSKELALDAMVRGFAEWIYRPGQPPCCSGCGEHSKDALHRSARFCSYCGRRIAQRPKNWEDTHGNY